jgi:acylphosphatase
MIVRQRVIYSGIVQGVGFRYTTQRLARGVAVAGFVRNLPNGTVELVVEGEAAEVQRLRELVSQAMGSNIAQEETANQEPQGLQGFRIVY